VTVCMGIMTLVYDPQTPNGWAFSLRRLYPIPALLDWHHTHGHIVRPIYDRFLDKLEVYTLLMTLLESTSKSQDRKTEERKVFVG